MSDFAELKIDGKVYQLPIVEGTEKERAIDISSLRSQSGIITLDPGYKNTGSTSSAITFLDGEKGILRYRGYDIEALAEKSNFLEVSYLIIFGELPTSDQLGRFTERIRRHSLVHEDVKAILTGFPSNAHPMGVLSSLISSLTAFYPESLDPYRSIEAVNTSIIRMIAKMPTLAAWSW